MFNLYNSFINALLEKDYVDDLVILFKKDALFDSEMWKKLKDCNRHFTDITKLYFLMGLSSEPERIKSFLFKDKTFGLWLLNEFSSVVLDKIPSYVPYRCLPEPFNGIEGELKEIYEKLLTGLPIKDVLDDRRSTIVTKIIYNSDGSEDKVLDLRPLYTIYILLSKKVSFFDECFSNYMLEGIYVLQKRAPIKLRELKSTVTAFDINNLSKVPEFIRIIFDISTIWIHRNQFKSYLENSFSEKSKKSIDCQMALHKIPDDITLYIKEKKISKTNGGEAFLRVKFIPIVKIECDNKPEVEDTIQEIDTNISFEVEPAYHFAEFDEYLQIYKKITIPVKIKIYDDPKTLIGNLDFSYWNGKEEF